MPEKMLLVIDGWPDTQKAVVGEWVAESLGGLLVDSEHIYRSLVTACLKDGVDIDNYVNVGSWCERAGVDIGFTRDGGRVVEANVAVNDAWFARTDFANYVEQVSKMAAYTTFWDKVRQILRGCDYDDRVVIVGSDIGFEFPNTPYKFFLDDTSGNRNPISLAGLAYPWMGRLSNYKNPGVTYFERSLNTLMIDASRATPADVVAVVLVESVARAYEMGFVGARLETALADAYLIADETRQRMRAALSQTSE